MKLLSIVFSFRNEEGNIKPLVERISTTMKEIKDWKYELIFVNDASDDESEKILEEHQNKFPITIINMSRTFGVGPCVLAGFKHANGDCVVYMDSDLQDPPEILNKLKNCDVVAIDEAQFFNNEIVDVCNQIANNGIRVIIAGLDMDYLGNPFGPMPNLMAISEYVTKVHAVCKKSGNVANYSYRKNKKKDIVVIGEKDKYEPLSRAVFFKKMKKNKSK